jgi:hypothetical protein
VPCDGEKRNAYRTWAGKHEGKKLLGNLGTDKIMIIK